MTNSQKAFVTISLTIASVHRTGFIACNKIMKLYDSMFIEHANMSEVFFIMLYSAFDIHATNFLILIYKHAITPIACIITPLQYEKNIL
jgi:hypothetical protein